MAAFLVVAILSMAFTKLAAGALIATGLPPDIATFQARSAFSGAGFTTTEAENVVNHPGRRSAGYLGMPPVDVELDTGDEIILYGRRADLVHLSDPADSSDNPEVSDTGDHNITPP